MILYIVISGSGRTLQKNLLLQSILAYLARFA
jgi:hypothetical protein